MVPQVKKMMEFIRRGLSRQKRLQAEPPSLPAYHMGKARIDLSDRDELFAVGCATEE